jgi:3-dehydroquinate dehydratase/shikimate dehydrogenase
VSLTDVDPICVVIGRTRHSMMLAEILEAARQGARLVEVRLDLLKRPPDFKRLLQNKPCQLVATARRPEDGGRWTGPEDARRMLLRQAIVSGFDWVDLETDVIDDVPRFGKVRRIVSYHNMRETPGDLKNIHARMCRQDADVVKIAVRAQHPTDNLRVLDLLNRARKPTVAFCMGDLGFPSRILGAKRGAPFTYAAFNSERVLAPGMPTFHELKKVYHYHLINADTTVFGVVGDPVAHSLSPLLHNLAFRKLGLNAVYVPFRVPAEGLDEFLHAFEEIPVRGYSVTIPHKEAAARLAGKQNATVERTQAANTLIRKDGEFLAYNTDYQAALDALQANMPGGPENVSARPAELPDPRDLAARAAPKALAPVRPGDERVRKEASDVTPASVGMGAPLPEVELQAMNFDPMLRPSLHGKTALILGAGGVARAIAHALQREGALLTISNRTSERAARLADEVGCRFIDWAGRHSVASQIVVNCTPVGMHPNVDESPLHPSFFKPGLVVFDTVYNPENTLLIKEARNRGAHVITGVELFVRQAALQFRLFTGRDAPGDLMRKVVKRALSPVTVRGDDDLL